MSYNRHDVICYCKPNGGGNSGCIKCEEPDIQKFCGFYQPSSVKQRCFNLKFSEYCGCYLAQDFANGKDVPHTMIPNFIPPTLQVSERQFAIPNEDLHRIIRKTRRDFQKHPLTKEDIKDGDRQEQGLLDAHYADMSELMGEFEKMEDQMDKEAVEGAELFKPFRFNPCKEITIGVDNSGNLDPIKYHELMHEISRHIINGTLLWQTPVEVYVSPAHLQEIMDTKCGAYCEKHRLYLDMSNPNLYTIYKEDGYFISIMGLYNDGIYLDDLDFRFVDGSRDFEEWGFEPLHEQVGKMAESGR